MNLILCVDEGGGMSFFGRRQSMDRVLRQKALALAGEGKLWHVLSELVTDMESKLVDTKYISTDLVISK